MPVHVSDDQCRPAVAFFALSVPFWVAGAIAARQVLPGLPAVDALIVVCPLAAACMLAHRERGTAGVKRLLARAVDYRRIAPPVWYAAILLTMPVTTAGAYLVAGRQHGLRGGVSGRWRSG